MQNPQHGSANRYGTRKAAQVVRQANPNDPVEQANRNHWKDVTSEHMLSSAPSFDGKTRGYW